MEGNNIRLGQQGIQVHVSADLQPLGVLPGRVGKHLHAEGPGQFSHRPADAAKADDADGLARQLHLGPKPVAEIGAAFPFVLMNAVVVQPHPVAQFQDQSHGKLGHSRGAVAGHVAHRDSPLSCGFAVHHIVAGSKYPDHFHAGALFQQALRHREFVDKENFRVSDAGNSLFFGSGPVINGHLAESFQGLPA